MQERNGTHSACRLRYRLPDEEWWSAGILENLSATGVLFHLDREIMVGSAILINLHLLADRPIRIVGRGSVVRLRHLPLARHPWIIAATIPIEEMRRL